MGVCVREYMRVFMCVCVCACARFCMCVCVRLPMYVGG